MLDDRKIPFSQSLNCLIGPRGNGKSAVIECLRHALDFPENSDKKYKAGLVERMLSPGGKVVVDAVDEHGREVRVEREPSGHPSVYLDGTYREISPKAVLTDILYFGQKDLSSRSETFDEDFLKTILADRLDLKPQEEARLIEEVRQAARQLLETRDASEKLGAIQKEKNELDVQLQVYVDKGVDKKLEEMTRFDVERQAILDWREKINQLGLGIKDAAVWDDLDRAFPSLRSRHMEPVLEDLAQAKARSDEAQRSVESALTGLRDAFSIVTAAMKKLTTVQDAMKAEVSALQKALNEPLLDLETFRKKKARLEQLNKSLEAGSQRTKTEKVAHDLLGAAVNRLHDFWRSRFLEREAEVASLQQQLPGEIRLQTAFKGKRLAFEEFLRGIMKGSGVQSTTFVTLREMYLDGRELYQGRADLEKHLSETAAPKIKGALNDHLFEFLTFRTPDTTEILYRDKPVGDYSLGQRATVLLHILMHLRHYPVILIDQPEDDLDNETLYSHFIHQLVKRKEETQFIFATHNPNIPVLGDAEQTIVCRKEGEQFSFEHGSIDVKDIQSRIVTVMEGGEDAFRRRKEIYQLWKSSN
jgi:ABC-type cobalamin/Fe3+-siderophores transport system ATPase subunit